MSQTLAHPSVICRLSPSKHRSWEVSSNPGQGRGRRGGRTEREEGREDGLEDEEGGWGGRTETP